MIMSYNCISTHDNIRLHVPFILYIIEAGSNANENTYFNSVNTGNNVLIDLQHKWFKS